MKRLSMLLAVAVLVLLTASCKCTAAKNAVSQIEATHDITSTMLLNYVSADTSLTDQEKARRKALVDTDRENIQKLKKALED